MLPIFALTYNALKRDTDSGKVLVENDPLLASPAKQPHKVALGAVAVIAAILLSLSSGKPDAPPFEFVGGLQFDASRQRRPKTPWL